MFNLIDDFSCSAIVKNTYLEPVSGRHTPIFPPTYATKEGYVINELVGSKYRNMVVIDTVGSQANRVEPIFENDPFNKLVHTIHINIKNVERDYEGEVTIFGCAHRIGDAMIRMTPLRDEIPLFMSQFRNRNLLEMAKKYPTSMVFGWWDSRGDYLSRQSRCFSSSITAFNFTKLAAAAQFFPTHFTAGGKKMHEHVTELQEGKKGSSTGVGCVPVPGARGGVLLSEDGVVIKNTIINLANIRAIRDKNPETQKKIQKYIYGLSLCSMAATPNLNLRVGCTLVKDLNREEELYARRYDSAENITLNLEEIIEFTKSAATDLGVDVENVTKVEFNPKFAKDLKGKNNVENV